MKPMLSKDLIDWDKGAGLIPAIIQDQRTKTVLMLGYMNEVSYGLTTATGVVHFLSRSRQGLWKKGESSGHTLNVCSIHYDCDADALLVLVNPNGPTCHRGTASCFGPEAEQSFGVFSELESVIAERWREDRPADSYVAKLKQSGQARIAQKFGEEAVETLISSMNSGASDAFVEESADMFFHWLVLAKSLDCELSAVADVLARRRNTQTRPIVRS